MSDPVAEPLIDYAAPSTPRPMLAPRSRSEAAARDVRAAYFLNYAMIGAVLPYVPVFFRETGFTAAQVGYAFAVWSASLILSPVLVTLAADTRADPRRLICLTLAMSGAALVAMGFVRGFWPVMTVWTVHCLVSVPLLPLQDGIYFSLSRMARERGERSLPYYRVRVWGTIGFIVPSVLLFALLRLGMPVVGALVSGAAFAAMGAVQSFLLPDPRPAARAAPAVPDASRSRLPTFEAARALFRPAVIGFVAAVLLGQMAGTLLGPYYPLYLTERAKVATAWVGVITNVGVVVEVFFVLAGGWLVARLGIKWVLVLGLACTAARFALMAASDARWVAIGTQLFHGIQILTLWIMPQTFLDRHADDHYRNSIQGVYVMLMSCGRAVSSVAAGFIVARAGLPTVFALGAGLCATGVVVALLAFRGERPKAASGAG